MDLVPIPGHTDDSFALYDRRTGVLLTGDTVYPGRLYVADFADFKKSIHRLAEFTDGKIIAHVLGNHIEQTKTPYLEYPIGKLSQPDEHELEMNVGTILELDRALSHMQRSGACGAAGFDDLSDGRGECKRRCGRFSTSPRKRTARSSGLSKYRGLRPAARVADVDVCLPA